jgi:hypothetical protein
MNSKKNSYKGISFCPSWRKGNKTFEQFKEEFENIHIFRLLLPKDRLLELKKAFAAATEKSVDDIEVKEAQKVSKGK